MKKIILNTLFLISIFVGLFTPFFVVPTFEQSKAISFLKETSFYQVTNKYYKNNKELSSFPTPSSISLKKNITQERLDSYISVTSDKLQAELFAVSAPLPMIKQTVGTYLGNVLSYNPQDNFNYPLSQEEILNYKYDFVKNEAQKLNIDVIDFYNYYETVVFETLDSLTRNSNFSNDDDSSLIINKYLYDFWKLLDVSQKTLPSEIDFTISLYNLLKKDIGELLDKFNNNLLFSANLSDPLYSVLKYTELSLKKSINISKNAEQFLLNLSDYSNNESKCANISIGDEIPVSFFPEFLNYRYNLSIGADLKKYKLLNISPLFNSFYSESALDCLFIDKQFDGFSSCNATYAPGEIYPGYTLHLYINDIDEISDSHKCSMSLIFGVSQTNSIDGSNSNNVLWDTSDYKLPNKFKKTNDTDKTYSPINLDIPINSSRLIKNISQNLFSKKDRMWIDQVWIKKEDFSTLPSGAIVWFNDSVDSRPSFESILGKYSGPDDGTYNLKEYPIILNPDEIKGVSLPVVDLGKFWHAHQKIVLVVDDVNTNDFYFAAHWAIVDFYDANQIQNNLQSDGKNFIELQNIDWTYKDEDNDGNEKVIRIASINIPYKVSEQTKNLFEDANTILSSLKTLYVFSSIINSSNFAVTDLIEQEEKELNFENELEIVYISSSACLLIDTISCFLFPFWTAGMVLKTIIVSALLVSSFAYCAVQAKKIVKLNSAIKSLRKMVSFFDQMKSEIYNDFSYISIKDVAVIDPHSNFNDKIDSATEIKRYYDETVRQKVMLPLFDFIKKDDDANKIFCVDKEDLKDVIDEFENALNNQSGSEHALTILFPFLVGFYIFDNFAETIKDVSPFTDIAKNLSEIKGVAEKWINPKGWRSWKFFKPLQRLKTNAIERLSNMLPEELVTVEKLATKIQKVLRYTAIFQIALMIAEGVISYYEEKINTNVQNDLSLISEELKDD